MPTPYEQIYGLVLPLTQLLSLPPDKEEYISARIFGVHLSHEYEEDSEEYFITPHLSVICQTLS